MINTPRLHHAVGHDPEELKAWSQNLGRQGMLVTLSSYGPITSPRQATLIRALACVQPQGSGAESVEQRLARLEAAMESSGNVV